MNRNEFLRQLEQLLCDIPENERREAMEFHRNYFEDAGPEKEAQIIEELGSPQEVAASIKRNLFGEGYSDYDFVKEEKHQDIYGNRQNKTTRNILIAVIIVLTFPLWVGIIGAAFGILIGGIAVVFALVVAVIAIVAALLIGGIVLFGIVMSHWFWQQWECLCWQLQFWESLLWYGWLEGYYPGHYGRLSVCVKDHFRKEVLLYERIY